MKKFIMEWRYSDGSSSGILPRVLSEADVELLKAVESEVGFDKEVAFTEVVDSGKPT